MKTTSGLKRRLTVGYAAFGGLLVVLIAEYLIGVMVHSWDWPYLLILSVAGASLTAYFFMHINQVRSRRK